MKVRFPTKPKTVSDVPLDSRAYDAGYAAGAAGRDVAMRPEYGQIARDSYLVGYEAAKRAIRLDLDPRIETKTVRRIRVKRK